MVDKKNPKEPNGSNLVQQNFELKQHVDNLEKLENRIMLFDEKLSLLAKEMIDMKTVSYTHLTLPTICSV